MYPYGSQYGQPNQQYGQLNQQNQYGQQPQQPQNQYQYTGGYAPAPQAGVPMQPTGLQPAVTGYQPMPPQMGQPMQAMQPTGQPQFAGGIAAPSAQSAFTAAVASAPAPAGGAGSAAVPDKRLSFITAQDQENFAQLFRASLTPGELAMSGDAARGVLMRSNLSSNVLGEIWQIADTTRSGALLFPEFCLAMHLCAKVLRGESLPREIHPTIKREVGDMVDLISFSIPDETPPPSTQASQFDRLRAQATGQAPPQQPQPQQPQPQQPQPTGYSYQAPSQPAFQQQPQQQFQQPQSTGFQPLQSQATGGYQPLQSQATGGYQPVQSQATGGYQPSQPIQSQATGGYQQQQQPLQQQRTGGYQPVQSQATGGYQQPLQSQATGGYQPVQSQATGGYQPLQQQRTGGYQQPQPQPLQQQRTGGYQPQAQPLVAMPTGKPGQWGFSNAQTPGMSNFGSQFMPQASGAGSTPLSMQTQTVEWAISKQEKQTYDGIFSEWDRNRTGMIEGAIAIDIFTKSGLDRTTLQQIWALCDASNRGKLDRDEFAVAMHLIYRKLNGYDVPKQLPPELVPPSTRNLKDSLNQVKQLLQQPSGNAGTNGGNVYAKSRSFTQQPAGAKKDATVFKNNDDELGGYVSAARHRVPPKSSKPKLAARPAAAPSGTTELAKRLRETRIQIDALKSKRQDTQDRDKAAEDGDVRAISELKDKIRSVQTRLNASSGGASAYTERKGLLDQLAAFKTAVGGLTTDIRAVDADIAAATVNQMRRQFERDHPDVSIPGTGPNGTITDQDRAQARRRVELKARMAAVTGRAQASDAAAAFAEFERAFDGATRAAEQQRAASGDSLRAVKDSLDQVARDLENSLQGSDDRERLRWEQGVNVEPLVKEFILELRPASAAAASTTAAASTGSAAPRNVASATGSPSAGSPVPSGASRAKESPAERIARIRAAARSKIEEKMASRGIRRPDQDEPAAAASAATPPTETPTPTETPAAPAPAEPTPAASKPKPKPPAPKPAVEEPKTDESDDEEARIANALAQKREHIKRLEEEKVRNAKKEEKDRRLAEMRKQLEELESQEKALSPQATAADAATAAPAAPAAHAASAPSAPAPAEPKSTPKVTSTVKTPQPAQPQTPQPAQPQTPQPAQPQTQPPASQETAVDEKLGNYNPFARPSPKAPAAAAPAPKAPAQAKAPAAKAPAAKAPAASTAGAARPNPFARKPVEDDAWGSEDDDESDDENRPTGAATPAQLASLLFGTMGGPQRQNTGSQPGSRAETPRATAPAATHPLAQNPAQAAPATPAAPPAPPAPPVPAAPISEAPQAPAPQAPATPVQAPPVPQVPQAPAPPAPHVPTQSWSAPGAPPAPPAEGDFDFGVPQAQNTFYDADESPRDVSVPPPVQAAAPPVPAAFSAPPPPPLPSSGAPPPPPVPFASAPPPPPVPAATAPPPPPPPAPAAPASAAPAAPAGGMAAVFQDIANGQGFGLRKVGAEQQKISSSSMGRVV